MKRFHAFHALVAVTSIFAAACISSRAFSAPSPGDGPILIAQLPEKPRVKKYDLRYKMNRGDVLRYEDSQDVSIVGIAEKTTEKVQAKTESVKSWKVTDVLANGDIEFMNVVESVHMYNQLPDRKPTEYDSTRDKVPPAGYEDSAKRIGIPLSVMRITPQGKIVSREMRVHGKDVEEDAPIVLRLPENPVAIGETWDEPFELKIEVQKGQIKPIQTRWHHKLINEKDGIATIEVTYQVLTPTDAAIELQLVQRMMSGTVEFDIEKGRIINRQLDADKRILGFAGPTSSMQYVMKMQEKLLADTSATASNKAKISKSSHPTQTANRQKAVQQQDKTYRR
jgi:hypothetical protein